MIDDSFQPERQRPADCNFGRAPLITFVVVVIPDDKVAQDARKSTPIHYKRSIEAVRFCYSRPSSFPQINLGSYPGGHSETSRATSN
jgi:hypothetical protein